MDKSELKLGEETLDRDHEELHALITRLLGASADDMVPALDALRAHAAQHFAMEDEHLRDMKDGNSKCHLDEHANVLKSFDEVREVLVGAAHPPEMKQRVVQSLSVELLDWLPHHVQEMDAGVATYRAKQRFGGAPVQISGMTPNPQAARVSMTGRLPDGAAVQEQAAFFVKGLRVYQASIIGSTLAPDVTVTFFAGLKLPS